MSRRSITRSLRAASLTAVTTSLLSELRIATAARTSTARWAEQPIRQCGDTRLGISFRPLQAEEFGLDIHDTLGTLLSYPFDLIRLSAYWDRMEPSPGRFDPSELDRQLDAAERAGKRIIVCLGAVKSFGYPEYFVPRHRLEAPLPEGELIDGDSHSDLLKASLDHLRRLVARYRDRRCIIGWQLEHDAVDPLGMEHSWRLSKDFVREEVNAIRAEDPARPVMLNGFLPMSTPVTLQQWWRTRDQGDSLAVAKQFADIVGVDFYPRHAIAQLGERSIYFDGARGIVPRAVRNVLLDWARTHKREIMVTEGQAEPWEAVTVPPNFANRTAYSCGPETLIENYNQFVTWARRRRVPLSGYLFWGAEYWVMRAQHGDSRYLDAFARVLEQS